jgi:hypothetical protein
LRSAPERQLWCAVLDRALRDATGNIRTVGSPAERERLREDALRWFVGNDDDFRRACEAAGLDPDRVRDHALQLISVASP